VRVSELGVKVAEMENDLEDTKEQLAEDKKFLADLDKNCALKKKDEWAAYKKMEAMELVALAVGLVATAHLAHLVVLAVVAGQPMLVWRLTLEDWIKHRIGGEIEVQTVLRPARGNFDEEEIRPRHRPYYFQQPVILVNELLILGHHSRNFGECVAA